MCCSAGNVSLMTAGGPPRDQTWGRSTMNSHRRFRRVRSIVLVALSLVCVSAQAQLLNKLSSVLTAPVGTTLRVLANVSGIVTSPAGDLLVGTAQVAGTGLAQDRTSAG